MIGVNRKTQILELHELDWVGLFAKFRQYPDDPHVSRVRRILELLKAFEREFASKGSNRVRLSGELNRLVGAYEWRSRVDPSPQGLIEVPRPPFEVTGSLRWEYDSVRWLLSLLRGRRELDLVHLCEMHDRRPDCAGWFYGRPNKTFCSAACKQYRYDSPEAVKARKDRNAKDNQEYRLRLKKKEIKVKEAVGFKGDFRLRAKASGQPGVKAKPTVRAKRS